jgi:hypothetical protein
MVLSLLRSRQNRLLYIQGRLPRPRLPLLLESSSVTQGSHLQFPTLWLDIRLSISPRHHRRPRRTTIMPTASAASYPPRLLQDMARPLIPARAVQHQPRGSSPPTARLQHNSTYLTVLLSPRMHILATAIHGGPRALTVRNTSARRTAASSRTTPLSSRRPTAKQGGPPLTRQRRLCDLHQ